MGHRRGFADHSRGRDYDRSSAVAGNQPPQRDLLEQWIEQTVGRPATVGDIEASWSGWTPRISAAGLALLDPARSTELVRFRAATINIALFDSLLAGSLKPKNLVLSGVALTLLRDEQGTFFSRRNAAAQITDHQMAGGAG